MANPKRRHSSARRDKRRTHDSLKHIGTSVCDNCGARKLPHHVCMECGQYKGREIVEPPEL